MSFGAMEMSRQRFRYQPVVAMILLMIAVVAIAAACGQESHLHLDFTNRNPPSFSFSGKSPGVFFEVMEVPRTKPLRKMNPFAREGHTIWKISASTHIPISNWPRFTYGETPSSFSQVVPSQGTPPKLIEHKLYLARVVGEDDAESGVYLEVQGDRIVNVTHKLFGQ